jgi:peptidoglycan/LPS O-acetylase OafA/YrhL
VAALAVVLFHVCIPLGAIVAPNGYLAVDFFFLLSGYVLARTYDDRLRGDLSAISFLATRLTRLYPLLFLGIVLGIGVGAIKYAPFLRGPGAEPFLATAISNLLILPVGRLSYADDHPLFVFDAPVWSLFWELVVNVIYAAAAPRLGPKTMGALIMFSAFALVAVALSHGSLQAGAEAASFGAGAARVTFSFFVGVAIHQLLKDRLRPRPHLGFVAVLAAAGLLSACLFSPMLIDSRPFDPLVVIAVFPVILILALQGEIEGRGRRILLFVGELSYPLYITHFPIMQIFLVLLGGGPRPAGAALALVITVELATLAVVALMALVFYDRPIQRWLGRRRQRRL